MTKSICILFILSTLLFPASAATSFLGYLYPSGGQQGTIVKVIAGGQKFGENVQLLTDKPGLTLKSTVVIPKFGNIKPVQHQWLMTWMRSIAEGKNEKPPMPELKEDQIWRSIPWLDELGSLNDLEYSLTCETIFTQENKLQAAPSLSHRLLLEIEIAPDAPVGIHRIRLVGNGQVSNEKLFFVDECRQIAEPLFQPPFVPKSPIPEVKELPAVLNGKIMPGEIDSFVLQLEKEIGYTFAMSASELSPYLGDAVPGHFQGVLTLHDENGSEVAFADDEYHHPDPVLRFTPKKSGLYTLHVCDSIKRGRADFVYRIKISKGLNSYQPYSLTNTYKQAPQKMAAGEMPSLLQYRHWQNGLDINGSIEKSGDVTFKVQGKKGEKAVFELFGARIDSPLDAVLILRDGENRIVAENDDAPQEEVNIDVCRRNVDPVIRFTFPDDNIYTLTVSDRCGSSGKDYFFLLQIRPPTPGALVISQSSVISVDRSGKAGIKLYAVRLDGFDGEISITGNDLRASEGSVIPAGKNEAVVALQFEKLRFKQRQAMPFELEAEYSVDGKIRKEKVIPADEVMQAFAYTHLLPAKTFFRIFQNKGKNKKE